MDCLPLSGPISVTSCFLPVCLAPQEVRKAWTKEALLPNDQTQMERPGEGEEVGPTILTQPPTAILRNDDLISYTNDKGSGN